MLRFAFLWVYMCSVSPEHGPPCDNISKRVLIANHYIIIISDRGPFTRAAGEAQGSINLN